MAVTWLENNRTWRAEDLVLNWNLWRPETERLYHQVISWAASLGSPGPAYSSCPLPGRRELRGLRRPCRGGGRPRRAGVSEAAARPEGDCARPGAVWWLSRKERPQRRDGYRGWGGGGGSEAPPPPGVLPPSGEPPRRGGAGRPLGRGAGNPAEGRGGVTGAARARRGPPAPPASLLTPPPPRSPPSPLPVPSPSWICKCGYNWQPMASALVTWCWWKLREEKLSLGEHRQLSNEPQRPQPEPSRSWAGAGGQAAGQGEWASRSPPLPPFPPPRRVPGGPGLCLDHADPPLPHRHVRLHEPAGVSGHQLPGHRQGRRGDLHEGECGAGGGGGRRPARPLHPLTPLLSALFAAAGPGPGQPRRQVHAGYLRRAALLHQGNNSPPAASPAPPSAAPAPPRGRPWRGGGAAQPRPARRRQQQPVKMADILLLYGGERLRALLRWRRGGGGGVETDGSVIHRPGVPREAGGRPRSASPAVARPPPVRRWLRRGPRLRLSPPRRVPAPSRCRFTPSSRQRGSRPGRAAGARG